ncbi:MAG TPA: hypothetical protein VM367_15000 [Pseudonocardia sp.]|nr:hypothetical protein [Pseudonocardia sp.]
MKTKAAVAVVTLAVAVPAFALTPTLFPPSPHMAPQPSQVPLFAVLGGINALALGLGVAFLAFGLPTVRRLVPSAAGRAVAAYLAIAWLLMSWYPHGGLHASYGMDTGPLLWIEYGFHVPLVVAPLVLIWALPSAASSDLVATRSTSPPGEPVGA